MKDGKNREEKEKRKRRWVRIEKKKGMEERVKNKKNSKAKINRHM